jgi:Lipase (class 3)
MPSEASTADSDDNVTSYKGRLAPPASEGSTPSAAADSSDSAVQDSSQSTPRVLQVLTSGRKDLWNSQYPYSFRLFHQFWNPIRDFVLDPLFALGTIILPPLVNYANSDYLDFGVSSILSIGIYMMKFIYRPIPIESHMNLRQTANQDFMINTKAAYHLPKYHPPSDLVSAFRGAIAFTLSVSADVISLLFDRSKMVKWMETLTEFKSYLDASGVTSEIDESIMKPLYSGRLLDNLKILNDIQEQLYLNRQNKIARTTSMDELKDYILEGKRLMRFATSAYGTEMIRSALDREVHVHELLGSDENEQVRKAIAFHSGIDVNDICMVEVNDGGDMHLLRHFVAIDHTSQSVVLAIRGTLSVSGALVDMTAMDCKSDSRDSLCSLFLFLTKVAWTSHLISFSSGDFCGNKAHKGMAEMANNIWLRSGESIKALFENNPRLRDYAFTIVGHSLGAGVACLLQIKCYKENLFGANRLVKCYGFAPPPTFCFDGTHSDDSALIQRAIENTVCYIHDNDCVPLLSVMSIRRFAVLMDAVDDHTEHIWFYRRFQMFWGWKDIPPDLVEGVKHAEEKKVSTLQCCDGASNLMIPAKIVIWMKRNPSTKTYDVFGCDSKSVADQNIFCWYDAVVVDYVV